jgi:hypothetical protein
VWDEVDERIEERGRGSKGVKVKRLVARSFFEMRDNSVCTDVQS